MSPKIRAADDRMEGENRRPAEDSGSSDRLLICDDDVDFCEEIADIAKEAGFQPETVSDSAKFGEAVARLEPHVVILDLNQPGLDGFDLLDILKRQQNQVRSILFTSGVDAKVLLTARMIADGLGFSDVHALSKPIDAQALRAVLQRLRTAPLVIEADAVDRAFELRHLTLYYQPKVHIPTGRVTAVEALIRWNHDRFGLLRPVAFMTRLGELGQMNRLTRLVIDSGVEQAADWRRRGMDLQVAINVGARSLDRPDICRWISQALSAHELPADRIALEVTETELLSQTVGTMGILSRLRMMGVGLAIDDFGAGFSELQSLYRMPFSEMKIDATFVKEGARSEVGHRFLSALVGLGRSLGLETCAEGVEDASTFSAARRAGCTFVQGYHISPPIPADELTGAFDRSGALRFGSSF